MSEDLRVGPVQILHDDEGRGASTGVRRHRPRNGPLAAIACAAVHRVIERAPFANLRQIKEIRQKDELLRSDDFLTHQSLRGRSAFLGQ